MGVAASRDNDDLADNLVKHGPIVSKEVELVFRLVDRGRFFPSEYVDEAYRDNPFKVPMEATDEWIPGKLHISAPSMYATVLEKLDLRPGHAFLNIGSGTGWLSTAAGFLIGGTGINHGVEIHENLIKFAEEKLADTVQRPEVCAFPWTKPAFFHGNGLAQEFPHGAHLYDRIYCGAAVSEEGTINRLVKLLEIGGKLIVPFRNSLMAYTRTAESSASSQTLMACQFADLLPPTENDRHDCLPPLVKPPSLADLCRKVIRESLRAKVMNEYPVFMRSIADDPEAMESDSSVTRPESNADMPEGDAEGDLNIVRHPIRVELFRNLGAARIRLESLDRRAHTRNRDARMRDVVTVQLQDGERQHAADGEDGEHDEEVGAGMFVFADEGPPSDDEELDEHNRMGLQWLNAILGFERDSPARRNRDDEEDRARSASPGDSSSDTSVADEAAEAEESGSADGLTREPENDERSNADSGNHVNGEHGSSSTSSDSTPLLGAEGRGDDEEESLENNHQVEEDREEEAENNHENDAEPDEGIVEDDSENWRRFPRDVMHLREFLVSTRNRNRAAAAERARNNRTGNVPVCSSSSRRHRPMSRRGAKRARIIGNSKQKEKLAEEERDRQHASLMAFGEAFNDSLWKLPLPKHLIKYLALQSVAPAFGSDKSARWG